MRDSTKVLWRVQARLSKLHKWVNKGTFETRKDAREKARDLRDNWVSVKIDDLTATPLYGYGDTRVFRIEKACS